MDLNDECLGRFGEPDIGRDHVSLEQMLCGDYALTPLFYDDRADVH